MEKSLGDTFEQFSSYQGTINSMMEAGEGARATH